VGPFTTGQVILVPFPFSDLTNAKLRPAVCLATADRGDWVLCQLTSASYGDPRAVELAQAAFAVGGLRRTSYARPGKLFTAHESLFHSIAGTLLRPAYDSVVGAVVQLLRAG
jgi:mRNA interferase MazF